MTAKEAGKTVIQQEYELRCQTQEQLKNEAYEQSRESIAAFIRSVPVTAVERELLNRIAEALWSAQLCSFAANHHGYDVTAWDFYHAGQEVIVELSRLVFLRGISGSDSAPPTPAAPMPPATPPDSDLPPDDLDARATYVPPDDPEDFDAWAMAVASTEPTHQIRPWVPLTDLYGPYWQRFTAAVRKAWGYRCGLCGRTDQPTEVHHNTYAHAGNERFFDVIPLCAECHERHSVVVERVDGALRRLFAHERVS